MIDSKELCRRENDEDTLITIEAYPELKMRVEFLIRITKVEGRRATATQPQATSSFPGSL
jgi:hypothetical protein